MQTHRRDRQTNRQTDDAKTITPITAETWGVKIASVKEPHHLQE